MQVEQGKYGATKDVYFELFEVDGVDLRTDWTPAAADCQISTDGGAFANSDNIAVVAPTGTGIYKVVVSASEMTGAVVIIKLVDAATKVFLDKTIKVETYGNASAMHAMDLDDADGSTLTEVGGDGAQLTEAGGDGDQLTAINLPNQTMDIAGTITSVTGDVAGNVDGTVAGKTPSEAGDAMNLAADAIKAVSYDESTAFPVKADDAGATQIARVGADGDTLETLSDEIAGVSAGDATEAKQDIIQADLDILTGSDGVILDTTQGNYAPNKVVPATKAEMDTGHGLLATEAKQDIMDTNVDQIETAVVTTIPGTITTAQNDLDKLTGSDGATLATAQGNYAPNVVVPATKAEMDTAHALLATPAQVNAQVLDVCNVDTFGEPGQGAPGATISIFAKINYLYKFLRNKITNDGSDIIVFADDGSTEDQKASVSEAAGTVTRGEFGTGA